MAVTSLAAAVILRWDRRGRPARLAISSASGAFANREYVLDMGLALAFGVIGYVARKS